MLRRFRAHLVVFFLVWAPVFIGTAARANSSSDRSTVLSEQELKETTAVLTTLYTMIKTDQIDLTSSKAAWDFFQERPIRTSGVLVSWGSTVMTGLILVGAIGSFAMIPQISAENGFTPELVTRAKLILSGMGISGMVMSVTAFFMKDVIDSRLLGLSITAKTLNSTITSLYDVGTSKLSLSDQLKVLTQAERIAGRVLLQANEQGRIGTTEWQRKEFVMTLIDSYQRFFQFAGRQPISSVILPLRATLCRIRLRDLTLKLTVR